MKCRRHGNHAPDSQEGHLSPAALVDDASEKRAHQDCRHPVDAHDHADAALRCVELIEIEREEIRHSDAHEKKKVPRQGKNKIPVPV
jgi:hypothetical protein